MDHAPGSFFTVDSNMVFVKDKGSIFDVSLIVSMDGYTSKRYAFTGEFDGTLLYQVSADLNGGANFVLNFTRHDGSNGPLVSFTGTISLEGGPVVHVSGSTYDNPVPYSTFVGNYYEYTQPGKAVSVMLIREDQRIMFKSGCLLFPIEDFVYNLNMFFFTYIGESEKELLVRNLLMGTDDAKGLVCSELTTVINIKTREFKTSTRMLAAIPFPDIVSSEGLNDKASELAKFAGYYQFKTIGTGAFVSLRAQNVPSLRGKKWEVFIGVSKDGCSSKQYKFDKTMTFTNGNTLTMPNQSIKLEFNREYNPTLSTYYVQAVGSLMGVENVFGVNRFNPVPLTGFRSVPLTNKAGDVLEITESGEIRYNSKVMEICYNPLMYVASYPPLSDTTTSFFLGTFGTAGVTAVITDYKVQPPAVSYVFAIPPKGM